METVWSSLVANMNGTHIHLNATTLGNSSFPGTRFTSTNGSSDPFANGSFSGRLFKRFSWSKSSGPEPPNIAMAMFLVLCIGISTIGNGAVLYIAFLKLKRNSFGRLNLLISSLALSDFLQTFSLMIPQLIRYVYGEWASGVLVCKIHTSLRSMQTNVSISILTLITIERFLYLDKLSDGSEYKSVYIVINVVVWLVHIALSVPLGLWSTVFWSPRMCSIPMEVLPRTQEYVVVVKTAFFFLPLAILWICNIGIIYKTRKSALSVRPLQLQVNQLPQTSGRVERERRTILTCILLAVVFTITHVPFETCLFILKSATSQQQIEQVTEMMFYLWPLTILNPCINPFIYSVFFKEFRQRVKEMMRCTKCPEYLRTCCIKGSTPKHTPPHSIRTAQTSLPMVDAPGNLTNDTKNYNPPGTFQIISLSNCDVTVSPRTSPLQTTLAIGNFPSPRAVET